METPEKERLDIYQMVTAQVIDQLKQGIVPWERSFASAGIPTNLATGYTYRSMNVVLLMSLGYKRNYFVTYEQAESIGGWVKKGEKGHIAVSWKKMEAIDGETLELETQYVLRYYTVFNLAQCCIPKDYMPEPATMPEIPQSTCEGIVESLQNPPDIVFEDVEPYYDRETDTIHIRGIQVYDDADHYYIDLFRLVVQSCGHESRLNWKTLSENPHADTLTGHIATCILSSMIGLSMLYGHCGTSQDDWINLLSQDNYLIFRAASQAQRAVDYILNRKREETPGAEEIVQEETEDDLPF